MKSINPATGEVIAEHAEWDEAKVRLQLEATREAFARWRRSDFAERGERLRAAARILRERRETYAELMAREMGKPVMQGCGEIDKCAWVCEYYAEHAERFLARQPVESDAASSFVTFQPIGVLLAVMPWNFPFWQVFRCAAPALMAGNALVLKHASNVCGCALEIERVFRDASLPAHLFATLVVSARQVEAIVDHPAIASVTLTGSEPAGAAVAAAAGRALKKTVLELGGSDPYVILEDAELPRAVEACVASRLINSGQSCIAAKRFIVVEAIRARFEALLVERLRCARVGDPLGEETEVGPLARLDLRDELHAQVTRSVERGATLLCGGAIPEGPGAWYPPTALGEVKPGMPAYEEELFGPVAAIITAQDEREAVRIANDSSFGLGAAVFTRDIERGTEIAERELEAGTCCVNAFVRSDPRLPFGGIKRSGYGRELGAFGIHELVNIKTVYVGK